MLCGPKGSTAEVSLLHCSACGRSAELFELPGRHEKYCLECSADVATSILLASEIDFGNKTGEDTGELVSEFLHVGRRLLARAQMH
jgi:hypothetical protein